MNFYITSGTPQFMEKLLTKYEKKNMYILYGTSETLLLHETEKKTVFQTPRKFEVVEASGELQQAGYFTFYHIPVSDEGRPVFEKYILERISDINERTGLIAYRLLRPQKTETYILLLQWTDKNAYETWKKYFPLAHALENIQVGVKKDNFFNAASYISTYSGIRKKEEKEER